MQNNPIKTIFVCEFITAGGFHDSDLPPSLVSEGVLMRDALLRDLSSLDCSVYTTIDARLSPPAYCDRCKVVNEQADVWQVWQSEVLASDAVWIIAPETDGYLEKVTALALGLGKKVIGCDLTSVITFSNKLSTHKLLKQSNIATIPTYTVNNWSENKATKWIAKPKFGAGCEETTFFTSSDDLTQWLAGNCKQELYVIQPFVAGNAASISCLMHRGKAHLLSCNEQLIAIENNALSFKGCIVNGMRQYWSVFETIANKIACLRPEVSAYVGIDVIVNEEGVTVVEVNPRLTTSYVALQEAIGHNPAAFILQLDTEGGDVFPSIERNIVKLDMGKQNA